MTNRNQLADGSTAPTDKFGDFLAEVPACNIDVSSIFPGAGTYAVTGLEGFGYRDEDGTPKSARVKLRIDKVASDANSKLVGRDFSIFFGLQTTAGSDAPSPISFTARRLAFLMTDEYPSGTKQSSIVGGWLKELADGMHFIIQRTVKRDKNGVLRANDKLISFSRYKELNGDLDAAPEEPAEVAADVGSF